MWICKNVIFAVFEENYIFPAYLHIFGQQSEPKIFFCIFCVFLRHYDRFSVYKNILTEKKICQKWSSWSCLIVSTMETKIFVNLDEMKTIFYAKSGFLGFLKLHILLFCEYIFRLFWLHKNVIFWVKKIHIFVESRYYNRLMWCCTLLTKL